MYWKRKKGSYPSGFPGSQKIWQIAGIVKCMQNDLFVFKQGQNNNFPRETVMAVLDCQYDYIWYLLKSKQLHTPISDFFLN